MSELFINTIADNCAGLALFSLPDASHNISDDVNNYGYREVVGFLSEDPVISMKNDWEAMIPDVKSLSDFTQLAGMGAVSWLSTSKAAWRGTDPITLTLNFYLLTYRNAQVVGTNINREDPRNIPVTEQAALFASLLAVSPKSTGDGSGKFAQYGINVHGGYRANFFEDTVDFTGNKKNAESEKRYQKYFADLDSHFNDTDGTISIIINGGGKPSMFFSKMLLSDATFTPSPVRCGYWQVSSNGSKQFIKSSEPLYIKVSATFRLAHVATVRDVARMFTNNDNIYEARG